MSDEVLTNELWQRLAPLIPVRPRRFRSPGRKPVDDRAALAGILYVLRFDVPWAEVPASFGVSGVTCWRRLRTWPAAGLWQALHERLLAELHATGRLDLHAALVDSSHLPALKGGTRPARPSDAGGPHRRPSKTRPHLGQQLMSRPLSLCSADSPPGLGYPGET